MRASIFQLLLGLLSIATPALAMNTKAEFLRTLKNAGIGKKHIEKIGSKIIITIPNEKITDIIQWLRDQGVENEGAVISSFLAILTYSIEDNLNPKAEWFKRQGVKSVGNLISRCPQVLGYGEERLNMKVAWFKAQGIKDVGTFISLFPPIVGLSIESNLNPTWATLMGVFGLTTAQIEANPSFLSASNDRMKLLAHELSFVGLDVKQLSFNMRRKLIRSISFEHILENLKTRNVIRQQTSSFTELDANELQTIKNLIKNKTFQKQFLKKPKKIKTCSNLL